MTNLLKPQVISLYKKILRTGKFWESVNPAETIEDRKYIVNEARRLFKSNKKITDQKIIQKCINEGEARLGIALHYRNPYPRPVNLPPNALAFQKGKKLGKTQEKKRRSSRPIYIQSIDPIYNK